MTSPETTPESTTEAAEETPSGTAPGAAPGTSQGRASEQTTARPAAPRPRPPRPRPAPPPAARRADATGASATPAATGGATSAAGSDDSGTPDPTVLAEAAGWGRVAEDGTVLVRSDDGEREVGQVPDATPEEAMEFFTRRYADLLFEVVLLEQRIGAGALGPDDAGASLKQVRSAVHGAHAVGDLDSLERRLDALGEQVAAQREQRRQEKARKLEVVRADKERIAEEAEKLAQGSDWRNGANRLRALLDEWKVLPRLDKSADDALWRRFSSARTTYTRRRKSHFAELNEHRDAARVVKERLVTAAEELADSTDWGPTSGRYRDLMQEWKAAGPAPKGVDDQLWKRFRGAQDAFFGARDAANAELDREFAVNAETKEALLAEAEALVPVTDLRAAKETFRSIAERWDAAGKVPRDRIKSLEGRMRAVEQAIRGTEDDQWRRSNPEARARAADTVAQLEASIADLEARREKAEAAGESRKAAEHADAAEARRAWLAEARRALNEFSG